MTERRFNQEAFRSFAAKLNPNVPDPTGVREAIISGCYPDIFNALRPLPYAVQERILVQGYGSPEMGMPNGAELGKFLARVNNIDWLNPHEEVETEFIKEKVHETQDRLLLPPKNIKIIKNWDAAKSVVNSTAWSIALVDASFAARGAGDRAWAAAAGDAAIGIVDWASAWEATEDISNSIEWIVIEDIMKNHPKYNKGNPFMPLVDMYEKGLWPIGQTNENFVVFHPPVTPRNI